MMDYLDVKRDDINYTFLHKDATELMKNAAKGISNLVRKKFPAGSKVCAVCGTGNNGGDALAALEDLRADYDVTAVFVKGKASLKSKEAKWALGNYSGNTASIESLKEILEESDVILDAIFGIGISGEPREPYARAIKLLNGYSKKIISVDLPSGMGTTLSVKPAITITFTDIKKGMDKENSGEILICDIGIPEEVSRYAGPGDLVYYIEPDPSSHKGMNGTLAIVGGWEFHGSSVIAGKAALKISTDLVRVYTSSKNYEIVASHSPYLIVRNVNELGSQWAVEAAKHGCILIGPGMGNSAASLEGMITAFKVSGRPLVIDADGIKAASKNLSYLRGKKVIFTPHHREFEILSGQPANKANAIEFAKKHSFVIALKGPTDIVTDGTRTIEVKGGNSRMTMGGTGDMLAGIIGACASRGIDVFRSAVMGSYINKKAAESAYEVNSYWYDIDDMMDKIPSVMMDNIAWAGRKK